MKVYHDLKEVPAQSLTAAVAIGNFDGVHLGHQALLSGLIARSKPRNLAPSVLTFYPHPVEVLIPSKKLERLTTTSEKLEILEKLGVDTVLVAPFNQEVAALSAKEFFDTYLKHGLSAKSVAVGSDFHFGKGRSGTIDTLRDLCAANQVELAIEPPFEKDGERVSSTRIRSLVSEAKMPQVSALLGRPYFISGSVARGDKRGRQLGFPTANLHCPMEKLLPRNGVYVTRVHWQKQVFASVSNVGVRPTFNDATAGKVVEVHLLDFSQRIYDEFLRVEFLECLREERRFSGVEELKAQIAKDIEAARAHTAK